MSDDLLACAAAYVEAMSDLDPAAVDDAARVIAARVAMHQCLLGQGWTVPGHVAEQLRVDQQLLRERAY